MYRAALTTAGRETVQCGLGAVQAMRIDMKVADTKGRPVGSDMAVWLTTRRRQEPVQMKVGLPLAASGCCCGRRRG